MIMVLSDGGENVAEAKRQLGIHGDKYFLCFSDVVAAARFGMGNVVITEASPSALCKILQKNKVKAVLDITETPSSELSKAALSVCGGKTKYVKYVNFEKRMGTEVLLSYREISERIRTNDGNVLLCASSDTVRAIAEITNADVDKMYVIMEKSTVFDTEKALEYSVPLLNVMEADMTDGKYAVEYVLRKTSANLMVCVNDADLETNVSVARKLGVGVIVTHRMGIEYPKTVSEMRDALIEIHSKDRRRS